MDLLRLAAAVAIAVALAAPSASADIFSPGPLAKGHADLEGLSNCTKCHVKGGQLSQERCLDCHKELEARVAKKKGLHGLLPPAQRSCNLCHHEHQGRDVPLVDWGSGGKKQFDHRKTGLPLEGKHAQLDCATCHVQRMILDKGIRTLIAQRPARATFLGLGGQCVSCHFDEHRGQLAGTCASCHAQSSFKPAPGFSHAKTRFPLRGQHASVACLKCHVRAMDADVHKEALLPPKSEVFERFKPVVHDSCTDCHKDPHEGRLGSDCTRCHSEEGWTAMRAATTGERAFHEKTRYPLRGAHVEVACRACHGPFPGVAAKFKNLRSDTCSACHVDAHVGQMGSPPQACDGCHTLQAFLPARYDPSRHRSFPLEGAHASVACSGCHVADASLASKAQPIRASIEKRRRHDQVSLTQFHPPGDTTRCDTCHRDPHRGQFAERVRKSGCADCHQIASFTAVRFDHARDSSFPLTGAHAAAACASCHAADASGTVRYKPLSTSCASCHSDPHAGQFATGKNAADCASCHATAAWKPATFAHRPPFTSFELEGKHAQVACASCHVEVAAAGGKVRRYRGVPRTCEQCHVDVHRGAFREGIQ